MFTFVTEEPSISDLAAVLLSFIYHITESAQCTVIFKRGYIKVWAILLFVMNPKKYFLIIIKNILDKVQMITQGFMHLTKEEPSFKIIFFAVSIRKDQSWWRLFVDNDFLWTLFSKWTNSSGHFQRVNSLGGLVNSCGHFLSTRILLLECISVDIFWVNSSGHFLMVITNMLIRQRRGCGGDSPF